LIEWPYFPPERLYVTQLNNILILNAIQVEARIYPAHRSSLKDYCRSGYDRGHMVPAADQTFSQEAMNETFYLSNICPQNAHLNRVYWSKIEKSIRILFEVDMP